MARREVALLIHGTGAAPPEDEGKLWWQARSDFCKIITPCITPYARCHKRGEVFHWSGKNSEKDRREAGEKLFQFLWENFEQKQRYYHLVAHSHGGQVIWHAFCNSVKYNKELKYMRSWCSFGTPFFQYRARIVNLWLVIPFVLSLLALVVIIQKYLWLFFPGWRLGWGQIDKIASLIMMSFCLVLFIVCNYCGFQVFVTLKAFFSSWLWRRRSKKAASLYTHYWLDIFSRHDEAIRALRGTLNPADPLIPRWKSEGKSWLARLLWFPVVSVYNTIAFFINEYTWTRIKRGLQGSDILGLHLDKVAWLYQGDGKSMQIPEKMDRQIVEWADDNIRKMVGPLRESLGDFGLTNVIGRFTEPMAGKEMVHSAYYQLEIVIKIVGEHIKSFIGTEDSPTNISPHTKTFVSTPTYRKAKSNNFAYDLVHFAFLLLAVGICWWSARQFYSAQIQSGILRADLKEANLGQTDLHGAKLGKSDLTEANLEKAQLSESDLQEADLWEANFSRADLSRANLSLANLDGANFRSAKLQQADLSSANMRETTLIDCNLSEACLNFADLQQADLTGANLYRGYLWSTNLREANFANANLSEARFFFADLSRANFTCANLARANFTGANLSGANLIDVDFSGAILSKAELRGADLSGANFAKVQGLTAEQLVSCKNLESAEGLSPEFIKKVAELLSQKR